MEFRDFSLLVRDTKVGGFVDGLQRGEILAAKCLSCGKISFPPRSDCPVCSAEQFEWSIVHGVGKLLTYTFINVPPEHFAPDTSSRAPFSSYSYHPSAVGIVEMEDGLRVMGWIFGLRSEALSVGMELSPRAEMLDDGRATISLRSVDRE